MDAHADNNRFYDGHFHPQLHPSCMPAAQLTNANASSGPWILSQDHKAGLICLLPMAIGSRFNESVLAQEKTVHPYESLKTEHTRTAQRTRTLLGPPVLGLWFLWKRHLSQQHFAGPIWYRRVWSSAVPSSASRRVTHRSWEAHPDQNSLPYPLKDHIVKTHAVKIDTNIDNLWSQAIDVNGTFTIPYTNITV